MKVLVIVSSPNAEGLTAACGEAARQGVVDGRSPARVINLNEFRIERCAVCDGGWGTCQTQHECCLEDDFPTVHRMFAEAEGYVWVTPVYFGEPSEPYKALFDRMRRCELTRPVRNESVAYGKPTICVAAAGGTGGGTVSCLAQMERWVKQLGADGRDYIPVTQRSRNYELETIHDALVALASAKRDEPQELPISARRGRRSGRPSTSRRRGER
ncbi:MAG: flavodoxin family protein [Candidatus Bipolaricaulota bacterium]